MIIIIISAFFVYDEYDKFLMIISTKSAGAVEYADCISAKG